MRRALDFFRRSKKLALLPALALGGVVLAATMKSKSGPKYADVVERATPVRFIAAPEVAATPRAVGYGSVQPGQVWEAVAEVGGKVVELHPDLKRGNILAKDTVLIRIDPAETGFVRGQSEADVQSVLAEIRQLDQREADTRRQLEVEQGKLELSFKDLERQRRLKDQGVVAASELDAQEQAYLTQRNAVENFQSSLNRIPAERQELLAKLASARLRLSDAQLDEERTVLRAPFDCRVADARVEVGEAVKVGDVLAQLDSINVSEAFAQVPLAAFRTIVPQDATSPIADGAFDRERMLAYLGISAVVRVTMADETIEWPGRLARLSDAVDPQTRTLGVYVAVDNTYLRSRGGSRPPLVKNMFAEVELRGAPRAPGVVVPRSAVHDDVVYVMNANDRLERRTVELSLVQSGFVMVADGVAVGERVVVSDLAPAIDGMLLSPVEDGELLTRLVESAQGGGAVR